MGKQTIYHIFFTVKLNDIIIHQHRCILHTENHKFKTTMTKTHFDPEYSPDAELLHAIRYSV